MVDNIVDHHCGDHTKCNSSFCDWQKLKEKFPSLSDSECDLRYSPRFPVMVIPPEARKALKKIFKNEITEESARLLSLEMTTNDNESIHSQVAMYSSGNSLELTES